MSHSKGRFYVIVNPAAGGGRCGLRAPEALARLREAGFELEVHTTSEAGQAGELARTGYDAGERRFLSVGGDGTAYEILNGLFPREDGDSDPIELGMLPLGTGNSFLRDFGIHGEADAVEALERGASRPTDVIRATHEDGVLHYINLLSIGFVAQVGDMTNRRFKALGTAGYVAAVVANVVRLGYPEDPVRLDEEPEDHRAAAFLSFSNSRYTGGAMMMAPTADTADGALDVIRVGPLSRPSLMATFPKIFSGKHVDHPEVEQARAQNVDFLQSRRQPVLVDGEVLELALQNLHVVPHAIRIIA